MRLIAEGLTNPIAESAVEAWLLESQEAELMPSEICALAAALRAAALHLEHDCQQLLEAAEFLEFF
jgi:hypothetical protein